MRALCNFSISNTSHLLDRMFHRQIEKGSCAVEVAATFFSIDYDDPMDHDDPMLSDAPSPRRFSSLAKAESGFLMVCEQCCDQR